MTKTRRTICILTAIALCVLTLFQALCIISVHCAKGSGSYSRFVAVYPNVFFSNVRSQSLVASPKALTHTWIRNKEPVTDEQNEYKLYKSGNITISSPDSYESPALEIQNSYNGKKFTTYHMRI